MSLERLIHRQIPAAAAAILALLRVELENLEQAALAADGQPALVSVPRNALETHIVGNRDLRAGRQRSGGMENNRERERGNELRAYSIERQMQ